MSGRPDTFYEMNEMNEIQAKRLAILAARDKNREKQGKTWMMIDAKHNKALRRLNRAVAAGMTTEKQIKASEKVLS